MRKLLIGGVAALAATTFALPAQADPGGGQAALTRSFAEAGGPFIGHWGAHGESVTVDGDGSGVEIASRGTLNFRLSTVQTSTSPWDTAYGNVTRGFLERGAFVTMQLVDGGQGMAFSAGGGDSNFPYCKYVGGSPVNSADCGA
jgi:hypothetical protein